MGVETSTHLFLHCELAWNVWLLLMKWFGMNFIIPPNLFISWKCWSGGVTNKKIRKGRWIEWHAAIWIIWKARNDRIFNNITKRVGDLVEEIKVLLRRIKIPACMFYEW